MATSPEREQANRALLEEYLRRRQAEPQAGAAPIPTRQGLGEHADRAPLSFGQRQLWLHGQLAPDLPVYNELITFHHRGPLKLEVLRRSFVEIVRRHEIWRTGFELVDGEAAQVVHAPPADVPIAFNDLRRMHASLRRGEALRLTAEDARIPFDLARGPLWRARLVRMSDEEDRIYLVIHHLILDGVTIYRVLLPELAAIYGALESGRPSPLPEPVLQYGDYALWQQEQAPDLERQISYWEEQLAGPPPPLAWPSDRVRAPIQSFRGATEYLFIPSDLAEPLRELARSQGATLYMALMASLAALLHRYTGQTDIVLGAMTAGRTRPELESLMGYFINPLALRIDVGGQPSFNQVLGRVRTGLLEALSNADVPFTEVVRRLHAHRDHSRNPFFTIMMTLEPSGRDLPAGWDVSLPEVSAGASKVDMNLTLEERAEGIGAAILYNPDLFERATVLRAFEHWTVLMAGLIANPDRSLAAISLLTAKERERVVGEYSTAEGWDTTPPYGCIHHWFEAEAQKQTGRLAVAAAGRQLTYGDLNHRANGMSRRLLQRGVGAGARVAVLLDRCAETVVAPLAIFKAGAVYVPFDVSTPPERLRSALAEADCAVVITHAALAGLVPSMYGKALILDDAEGVCDDGPAENLTLQVLPSDPAYILFTSGSTGVPKGVEIRHDSLTNLLWAMRQRPGLAEGDVLVAISSAAFDISLLELLLPVLSGAKTVVAGERDARDGRRLLRLLEDSDATVMQATPATWQMLIEAGWQGQPALKVLCGGEAMPAKLARELTRRSDSVWNLYGPTETTIWSTIYRVRSGETGTPPIGRPIANTQVYVLDEAGEPVPAGVTGELCIGGAGLAAGYFHRPEETAARFRPNPFDGGAGNRLYSTGDKVAFRPDGALEFRGRDDGQFKVRGYRIEAGDVESALLLHPAIGQCAVTVRSGGSPDPAAGYLAAYFTAKTAVTASDLHAFLAGRLPAYMVPSRFVRLERLPVRASGKIDRQALPEPPREGQPSVSLDPPRDPPRNESEGRLCGIWRELLQVEAIGIHQNFWDLGGHSLLAARLMYRVERDLGVDLPVSALLLEPTVAGLAARIETAREGKAQPRPAARKARAALVPLHPAGALPPIFLVCAHAALMYRHLVKHLGDDQPVWGVVLRDSLAASLAPPYHVSDLAELVAAAIMDRQPQGGIRLAGLCLSGVIAYETARSLASHGRKVEWVGLFLTRNPASRRNLTYESQMQGVSRTLSLSSLKGHWRQFQALQGARRRGLYLQSLVRGGAYRLRMLFRALTLDVRYRRRDGRLRTISEILLAAAQDYHPLPLQTRVALFKDPTAPGDDPCFGWGDVMSPEYLVPYELVTTGPVTDSYMFGEPTVSMTAREIRRSILEAQSSAESLTFAAQSHRAG